jgi:hypothetical protein
LVQIIRLFSPNNKCISAIVVRFSVLGLREAAPGAICADKGQKEGWLASALYVEAIAPYTPQPAYGGQKFTIFLEKGL